MNTSSMMYPKNSLESKIGRIIRLNIIRLRNFITKFADSLTAYKTLCHTKR